MQENYEKIQAAGAELFAISSENVSLTKGTAQKEGLTYPVLADSKKEAINAYNVLDQTNKNIARPASFIISQEGNVAWISLDAPAVRVPTSTILTELGKI
ncbi:peroxiredoxin family protein [Candidatus Poribacteria bacterium]|nr:peroxiredoxin family protein [Candidatus Poribacteria bacterium]